MLPVMTQVGTGSPAPIAPLTTSNGVDTPMARSMTFMVAIDSTDAGVMKSAWLASAKLNVRLPALSRRSMTDASAAAVRPTVSSVVRHMLAVTTAMITDATRCAQAVDSISEERRVGKRVEGAQGRLTTREQRCTR